MKQFFAPFILILSLSAFHAHGADPVPPVVPDAEMKDKVQGSQSEGAIKVEKRHAVSPEALREQDEMHAEKTSRETSVSEPHLFGLHAGLGLPHPLNYGLNYVHTSRLFSAELSTGSYSATVSDVKAKIENSEIALRWHPWAGSFFLGTLLGTQKISGERTASYTVLGTTYTGTAKVEIKSGYVTPHLGWMWGGQNTGFFYNFEFGVQFPTNPTTDVSSDVPVQAQLDPDYIKNKQDVQDQAEKIGKSVFPYIALIKIGYLF